ncbi:MAG: hypothetical protein IKV34_04140 [Clostridia bacterium]|nr:hypothetical protein [Clostridia bacterium]
MENIITQEQALQEIEKNQAEAEKIIKEGKIDKLIIWVQSLIKELPKHWDKFAYLPTLISFIKDVCKGKYKVTKKQIFFTALKLLIHIGTYFVSKNESPDSNDATKDIVIEKCFDSIKLELDTYQKSQQLKLN